MLLSFIQTSVMRKWQPDPVANGKRVTTSISALIPVRHLRMVDVKVLAIDLKIGVNVNPCA